MVGLENHIRIWNQPVQGSTTGAWFITASFEYTCIVPPSPPITKYPTLWHCVDYPNGYNNGASNFVAKIQQAAQRNHWGLEVVFDTRAPGSGGAGLHSGAGTGLNGVAYSDNVYVVTVTTGSLSTGG